MLTHLISTTEFVKLVKDNSTSLTEISIANQYIQCLRYANFVSRKPELWMFVPCDEDGNVLEEPEQYNSWLNKKSIDWGKVPFNVDLHTFEKYKKAQSKVLFKFWKLIKDNDGTFLNKNEDFLKVNKYNSIHLCDTLEEIIKYGGIELELTETALKQIL